MVVSKVWNKESLLEAALTSRSFMVRNLFRRQLLGKARVQNYWERRLSLSRNVTETPNLSPGVEVYGFFTAEIGLGQAARGFAEALKHAGIRTKCHTLLSEQFSNSIKFEYAETEQKYDTALICANADLVANLGEHIKSNKLIGRRKLSHWAWELPVFPAAWALAFEKIDEIWTASRFVARAVAPATGKAVRVVPYVAKINDLNMREARTKLNLPKDAYIFLTAFDLNSYFSRKNPLAVIKAFRAAFPKKGDESVLLVLKYHGDVNAQEPRKLILEAADGDPRIISIDKVLSPNEMDWLRASCDAFVSLHRSEGFGLNIAEAMSAGKLAIATDFSGNVDFMSERNSLPIPFKMTAVGQNEYPFGAGQWWAEPDDEAAVEALRWASHRSEEAVRIAKEGKNYVREHHSPQAIARVISEALNGRSSISFS